MSIRSLPMSRAWTWFLQAVNLGMRNPRAVFGAALLMVATLYLLVMAGGLLGSLVGGGSGAPGTAALALMLMTVIAVFQLVPVLIGGLMYVIHEAESGRPALPRDLFAPFRQGRAGKLAAFGSLQIVAMLLGGFVTTQLAGSDYMAAYSEAVNAILQQKTPAPLPAPAHPGLLFVWQIAFNYLTTTVMLLGIALVALSGKSFGESVRAALHAAGRNFAPNMLAAVLFFAAVMIAGLMLSIVGSVVMLVLSKIFMPLAFIVFLLLAFAFITAVLVVVCGGGYLIWRDTFIDASAVNASTPPAAPHHIEA